jgi:hypothetical protein
LDAGVDYRRGHRRACSDIRRNEDTLIVLRIPRAHPVTRRVVAAEGETLYSIQIRPHSEQKDAHDGQHVRKGRAEWT